jgi:transcription elongation factor GreB
MSRAFVNEDQLTQTLALPEREVSPHPNYVTPRGLALLKSRFAELESERSMLLKQDDVSSHERLAAVERDLRYYAARMKSAKLVPASSKTPEHVKFGCRVTVVTPAGEEITYTLVGEDEADAEHGLISWVSPLGQALLGAHEDDQVQWQRPAGEVALEVVKIEASESKP